MTGPGSGTHGNVTGFPSRVAALLSQVGAVCSCFLLDGRTGLSRQTVSVIEMQHHLAGNPDDHSETPWACKSVAIADPAPICQSSCQIVASPLRSGCQGMLQCYLKETSTSPGRAGQYQRCHWREGSYLLVGISLAKRCSGKTKRLADKFAVVRVVVEATYQKRVQ